MLHDVFNEKLYEFAKDLNTSFPEIEEFKQFKLGVQLAKNVSEKAIEPVFRKHISQFRDEIMEKNEKFFLEEDYKSVMELAPEVKGQQFDNTILKLKSLWKTLNEDNKEAIWKYLKLLILISDKCQH